MLSHFQSIVSWRALPSPPYFDPDQRVIELLACGHEGNIAARTHVETRIARQALRSCLRCWTNAWSQRRREARRKEEM